MKPSFAKAAKPKQRPTRGFVSADSPKPYSDKVIFTKMTSEEHAQTRVKVYPYLVP